MPYEDKIMVASGDSEHPGEEEVSFETIPSRSNNGVALYWGTCTTAANEAIKIVTLTNTSGFTLNQGTTIAIEFSNTNTYSATEGNPVQLNVNGTGPKNIKWGPNPNYTGTNTTAFGRAGYVNTYIYDGTYWVWQGSSVDNNSTSYLPTSGGTVTGTAIFSKNTDASGTADNGPALVVGGTRTAAHIEIDANEVMAKSNGTTPTTLFLNTDGGIVQFGGQNDKIGAKIQTNGTDKPAAGAVQGILQVFYKNADGSKDYSTSPICIIGTDGTDGYNTGVSLGSRNGTTFVSAGESSNVLPSVLNAYNNEILYLTSDSNIRFIMQAANDGSSYKSATLRNNIFSGINTTYYGTCSTAADTRDKVVTIENAIDFQLVKGVTVIVQFTVTNTVGNPRLNVNDTGAKDIKYNNSVTTNNTGSGGTANYLITYVYDGTAWNWMCKSADNNNAVRQYPSNTANADYRVLLSYGANDDDVTNLTRKDTDFKYNPSTNNLTVSKINGNDASKTGLLDLLHPVGTIIESTTCDTMAKVVAAYGGTTWIQHTGYMLRGATSGVTANRNVKDGGSDTVTLTGAQSGLKGHGHGFTQPTVNGGATNTGWISANHGHNYRPSYKLGGSGGYNGEGIMGANNQSGTANQWNAMPASTTDGVNANHYHPQAEHTHTVAGGAVHDAAASNATSSHSVVPNYKNVYIWERTA